MKQLGDIREITSDDLDLMLSWRNAVSVRKNMYTQKVISYETHLAWWEAMKGSDDQQYFIYEHEKVPMGVISFNAIDPVNCHCFWAFYASPDAPRGSGTKMEFIALNYAFEVMKLRKLSCEVLAYNKTVIKLHEKFGFHKEGLFREHHEVDAKYVDVHRLGILQTEWIKQKPIMQKKLDEFNGE